MKDFDSSRCAELIDAIRARNGGESIPLDKCPVEMKALGILVVKAALIQRDPTLLLSADGRKAIDELNRVFLLLAPEVFEKKTPDSPSVYATVSKMFFADLEERRG